MSIYPIARLPDKWIDQARDEGAHVDVRLKSPWQLFAAFEGDTMGGFIGLLLVGERRAHVRGWYVFPEHRGSGIGGRLLRHAMEWATHNEYDTLRIRTTHDVEWAGFVPTGHINRTGRQEVEYEFTVPSATLPGVNTPDTD